MPNVAPARPQNYDWSGIIPHEFSTQIIEEAVQQSAVLQLANLMPMGTSISELPIPRTLPKAAWVSAPTATATGRKPYTSLMLETQSLKAEEVAAVTAIPDVFLEDSEINLWNWVRPRLAEAIAVAVDEAILFGIAAPTSFPTGGVVSNTYSTAVARAQAHDAVDAVNLGMGRVEAQGLAVSGHAADLTVKQVFRGVRDSNGALLLGTEQAGTTQRPTLYGVPIAYNPMANASVDYITGAWQYLLVGVRQDIRYAMDPSATIADADGQVVISGFQDNVTPLKVWARFGCAIVKPVTVRAPAGATPFARAQLTGWPHFPETAPPLEAEPEDEGGSGGARSAKK
jgi:HK97 family phage major capsid protein